MHLNIWILGLVLLLARSSQQTPDGNTLQAWRRTWKVVPAQVERTWRGNNPCNAVPAWFGISCNDLITGAKKQRVTQIDFTDPEGKPVRFQGRLPEAIGKLTELQSLEMLDLPFLQGTIPASIKNLKKLYLVYFMNTRLSGGLNNLARIPNLRELWVDGNKFTGRIPNTMPKSIVRIGIYNEDLVGKFPRWKQLNNLLSVEFNNLKNVKGPFPRTFKTFSTMDEMVFRGTGLRGKIPGKNFLPKNMRYLRLAENKLSGVLPKSWGQKNAFKKLRRVDLYQNAGLKGKLPAIWARGKSSKMRDAELYLKPGNNRLCGKVPNRLTVMDFRTDRKTKTLGNCAAKRRRRNNRRRNN